MIDINTDNKKSRWKNQIRNLPITIDNINREETIYGPHIPIIQVKAIRRSPKHHKTTPRIPLSPPIEKHQHNV